MPNSPLTRSQGLGLVKLILVALVCQLFILGYVFYQSYQGRVDLVGSQRAGCERGKLDRTSNSEGWRIAEAARRGEGQTEVADQYALIAKDLETRSILSCSSAFPSARLIP